MSTKPSSVDKMKISKMLIYLLYLINRFFLCKPSRMTEPKLRGEQVYQQRNLLIGLDCHTEYTTLSKNIILSVIEPQR